MLTQLARSVVVLPGARPTALLFTRIFVVEEFSVKARYLALAVVITVICSGSYTYYYSDSYNSINSSYWTQNGALSAGSGLTSSDSSGGSLISTQAAPGISSEYEVKSTLTLTQSGGTYSTYLRASSNALSGPSARGTAYVIEVQNPTFSGGGPQPHWPDTGSRAEWWRCFLPLGLCAATAWWCAW